MSLATPGTVVPGASDDELDGVTRRGLEIYDSKLKTLLEPKHDNEYVAIHVDSGDHTVARSTGDAMRAIRKIHPEGQLLLRKIGSEPEYGLAARLLAGEMMADRRK